jgi:endonuclease/exonuclease/phosphatase (EEP) superfamily protein YafD
MAPVAVALLLLSLAPRADHLHWTIALAAHFPVQGLALSLLLALAWFFIHPRRTWVLLLLVTAAAIHGAAVAPLFTERDAGRGGPPLRVLSFNTWPHNDRASEIWEYVDAMGPDIAVLFESAGALHASGETLSADYRSTTRGEFIVLTGRGVQASIDDDAGISHAVALDVRHEDKDLRLVFTHPYPAVGSLDANAAAVFDSLERECLQSEVPVAVLGDLNTTPWGFRFRELVARGTLMDSGVGRGLQPSFPAWPLGLMWLFGIPIDHCLFDEELVCTRRDLGPALGSNHRPLLVELAWRED